MLLAQLAALRPSITGIRTYLKCATLCSATNNGYKLSYQIRRATMAVNFQEYIKTERKRLNDERKGLVAQQREAEKKLADIDRELAAIGAYETAKAGKAAKPAASAPRKARAARKAPAGARRGSRREPILNLLAENSAGLSRGELLEKMGLKGDKSGEMSVSNALTALSKGKQVARKDGKYVAA